MERDEISGKVLNVLRQVRGNIPPHQVRHANRLRLSRSAMGKGFGCHQPYPGLGSDENIDIFAICG